MGSRDSYRSALRADCASCVGLCCVVPGFSASADFAMSKPPGTPCRHLRSDFGCGIHDRLRPKGFPGCTVYDCFGAGQKVAQVTFGGTDWRAGKDVAARMFTAFPIMRRLHELLWYLGDAMALPAAAAVHGDLAAAYDETERLSRLPADEFVRLDPADHARAVHTLLNRASALARAGARHPDLDHRGADMIGRDLRGVDWSGAMLCGALLIGADLRGADLSATDVIGADLRGADLRGADLTGSIFLIQSQLDAATGDGATRLDAKVRRPEHWSAPHSTRVGSMPPVRRPASKRPGPIDAVEAEPARGSAENWLPRGSPHRKLGRVRSFDDLIAEGSSVPVEGWDFSWFEGRATEERPPWGYARLLGERMSALAGVPDAAALDLQTGGGEVLATAPAAPATLIATETWPPNVELARRNLATLGGRVVAMDDEREDLPFDADTFDLVVSRHPVGIRWDEVARVLKPGGRYLSQDVGHGSVAELTEFMMGARPVSDGPNRDPKWSVRDAEKAGLVVDSIREFRGRMEFRDVAAVVYFLRKVIWIVPGFTVDRYQDRLRDLHEQIVADGPIVATSVRFLIEAHKPK